MVEVLERGDIGFFFRPRVQSADAPIGAAPGEPGVQSFFLVLSTADGRHRRVRVGRKRMPVVAGERLWARVERVGSLQRVLGDQLESEEYSTKTRGDRYQPGARPIGRGSYAFVRHDDHVHLVYRLDHREDDVPDDVRVAEVASDLVLFDRRTREDPEDPEDQPERTPERESRTRATWTTTGDPTALDAEGAELVIIGAAGDAPERDLGVDVLAAPAPTAEPEAS